MHTLQLYIKQQQVDLTDDTPIALTFQINNLAEVKNQQGNTSNQFKLPLTHRNRAILGFPDEVAFCMDDPYQQLPARIIQDGMEIIPYGIAEINSVEQDVLNITILSGNVDFFDAIDAKIYDMGDESTVTGATQPFAKYDHKWTVDSVAQSQSKTEGWIWPVIDYGKLTDDASAAIDIRYMRPGFFLKTAIETIVTNAGFKARGSLLNDQLYNNLIVQFANDNFEHGTEAQSLNNSHAITVINPLAQTLKLDNSDDGTQLIRFTQIESDPGHCFNPQTYAYAAADDINVDAVFNFDFKLYGTDKKKSSIKFVLRYGHTDGTFQDVTEMLFDLSNDPVKENGLYTATFKKQSISYSLNLKKGEAFLFACIINKPNSTYGVIDGGASFKVATKEQYVLPGQTIQCERIFPDISQKDLIKDTLQRFGIICQTDNAARTVTFASFKDIVNNIPNASDWTEKCIDQGKTISYQLGGYAQANNMKYKADDNVLPIGFADSVVKVADATLPATADLFESQFAPSLTRPWRNNNVPLIIKADQSDPNNTDFIISTQPRILIRNVVGATGITFTDGVTSRQLNSSDQVCLPYFYLQDRDPGLTFENLRQKYYPELERILKNTKKVVRLFLLTPRDIAELDLLIPVYLQQDSAYYYINKIDAWQKGKPTKVELVKLG